MTTITLPPLPEPELFTHELLGADHDGSNNGNPKPNGVHLGVSDRGVCEQAHTPGDTCEQVNEWFSAYRVEQMRRDAVRAALWAAVEACESEAVLADSTKSDEDYAYNSALEHAVKAIRALMPKEEN